MNYSIQIIFQKFKRFNFSKVRSAKVSKLQIFKVSKFRSFRASKFQGFNVFQFQLFKTLGTRVRKTNRFLCLQYVQHNILQKGLGCFLVFRGSNSAENKGSRIMTFAKMQTNPTLPFIRRKSSYFQTYR